MKNQLLCLLTVLVIFSGQNLSAASSSATATDQHSQKIESVLDKLEKRIIDKESAPLTYDEQRTQAMALPDKPKETISIPQNHAIKAQTPNHQVLTDIQAKINEYDGQIDILEAEARKAKSQLIQNSTTDNLITVDAKLKNPKAASLQSLTVKIDGSMMFHQVNPAGLWIPASAVKIYQGPMQPGEHTVEVHGVLQRTNDEGLAIAGWTQQAAHRIFKIDVDEGRARKAIVIELSTSNDQRGKAVAEFKLENLEKSHQKDAMKEAE